MLGARLSENRGEVKRLPSWFRAEKKVLDIFLYGNVTLAHGTSGNDFGCFQRGGGATAARDSELSGAAGAAGRGNRRFAGDGAALGVEAPSRFAPSWPGGCAPGWPPDALPDQRRGDPAPSRVDGNI